MKHHLKNVNCIFNTITANSNNNNKKEETPQISNHKKTRTFTQVQKDCCDYGAG